MLSDPYFRELLVQKTRQATAKRFCSWVCVKGYANNFPRHQRHEKCMLVDLSAGYFVPLPSK